VHCVVATQCALVRMLAGAPRQRFLDGGDHECGLVRLVERHAHAAARAWAARGSVSAGAAEERR
jgi:hypothetical protein